MSVTKQGLVISSNYNNKDVFDGTYANGDLVSFSSSAVISPTLIKTPKEHYTNYHIEMEKPSVDSWINCKSGSFTFEVGATYVWKCAVRCNECTNKITYSVRASRAVNDWVTNVIAVCSSSLADGKWHEYYVTQVINSTFTRSGSTVTSVPLFEMYSNNLTASADDNIVVDFDLTNVQVVKSDVDLPVDAFYEIDDNPFGIGSDFVRTTKIYEI